jgi:hypothetical protein
MRSRKSTWSKRVREEDKRLKRQTVLERGKEKGRWGRKRLGYKERQIDEVNERHGE